MTFHGISWVPDKERSVDASEATTLECIELGHKIRLCGLTWAKKSSALIESEYKTNYQEILQLQQQLTLLDEDLQRRRTLFSSTEWNRIMKVIDQWRNMTDEYNTEYEALDGNEKEFVNDQYNYLAMTEAYKVKENDLWKMNSEAQILTHVTELWNVEVSNASTHITRLKEQLNVERLRQAELQKASRLYIQRTFQKVKRNRLTVLEQEDFNPTSLQPHEQLKSVVDKLGNLLDMISVNETTSSEKRTNKASGLSEKSTNALQFL